MKYILFFVILSFFCFTNYADDSEITVDDLSAGTEIILDGNTADNKKNSQEFSANETEQKIEEDILNTDESLPGANPINVPIKENQQPITNTEKTEQIKTEQITKLQQTKNSPDTIYTVQLGAFKARERAFAFHWKISKRISNTRVDSPTAKNKLYKVCCGTFPNYEEAKAKANKLKKLNIKCFIAKTTLSEK